MPSVLFLSELTHDQLIHVKGELQRKHTNARADAQLNVDPVKKMKFLRLVAALDTQLMRIYNEFERRAAARTTTQSLYSW
jgi:hypothetical protein